MCIKFQMYTCTHNTSIYLCRVLLQVHREPQILQNFFKVIEQVYIPISNVSELLVLSVLPTLDTVSFLFTHLVSIEQCLFVVLFCIFLLTSEVERRFICLTIWISSFVKCLFQILSCSYFSLICRTSIDQPFIYLFIL